MAKICSASIVIPSYTKKLPLRLRTVLPLYLRPPQLHVWQSLLKPLPNAINYMNLITPDQVFKIQTQVWEFLLVYLCNKRAQICVVMSRLLLFKFCMEPVQLTVTQAYGSRGDCTFNWSKKLFGALKKLWENFPIFFVCSTWLRPPRSRFKGCGGYFSDYKDF